MIYGLLQKQRFVAKNLSVRKEIMAHSHTLTKQKQFK